MRRAWRPLGRSLLGALLLLALSLQLVTAAGAAAPVAAGTPADSVPPGQQTGAVYFPETGHHVPTVFHDFWTGHGGLPAFGYPLTEAFRETSSTDGKTYLTQYFERARFEHHPELAGSGFEVQLGHLGAERLGGQRTARVAPFRSSARSVYFVETGHSLANGFKHFWENNGGLRVFGYPITEELREGGQAVQYFERARFEYHPELQGTPYEVLLTLLGRQVLEDRGWALPAVVTVGVTPDGVVQGRTATVLVQYDTPVTVEVEYGGAQFSAGLAGERRFAVLPTEAWADPGWRPVTVTVTDDSGTSRVFERRFLVTAGQFPVQRFPVPSDRQSLLDPELGEREWQIVKPAYEQVSPARLWDGPFVVPLSGRVTTEFGTRRAYNDGPVSSYHASIDLAAPEGTPVRSDAAGRVVLAQPLEIRGNTVIVDHGLGVHSAYFHLSSMDVKEGDVVQQGQVIGRVGNTGLSTGPHLHWEVRIGTIGVDPMEWVERRIP